MCASAVGCMGTPQDATLESADPDAGHDDLPVLGVFIGEFDGHEITIRPIERTALSGEGEVGLAEAPLVDLPNTTCSFTNPTLCVAAGANRVAIQSVEGASTRTNGVQRGSTWVPSECGGLPDTGVCQSIRIRSQYESQQLERVYLQVTELEPRNASTTAVFVPTGPQTWAGVDDFGESAPLGTWRIGEVGRNSPTTPGAGVHFRWAFHGTTTGTESTAFQYRFVVTVRGLLLEQTRRASVAGVDSSANDYASVGMPGATVSGASVGISDDGRFVTFVTSTTALTGIAGTHVVRHDMETGENVVVTASGGSSCIAGNPSISNDGSVIAFHSRRCTLVPALGAPPSPSQVYAYDHATGSVSLISRSATGGYGNGASQDARISGDGNVVVFQSPATNLDVYYPAARTCIEAYRYERSTDVMTHVSAVRNADIYEPALPTDPRATYGYACNALVAAMSPDVSDDGNLIVFVTSGALDPSDDTDTAQDVYVYDHALSEAVGLAQSYRVSRTGAGDALTGGTSTSTVSPAISGDGEFVAFATSHRNVCSGAAVTQDCPGTSASGRRHIYRRATAEGSDATIARVTLSPSNTEPGSTVGLPTLSRSGRFVAFLSQATTIASVAGYSVQGTQAYVCDMQATDALRRCWVASRAELTPGVFTNMSSTANAGFRVDLAYPNDADAGYIAYTASPSNWGPLNSTFGVYVSPASIDPRSQQVAGPSL